MDHAALWTKEYEARGIFSSFRTTPTKAVIEFVNFLEQQGFKEGRALDLGCGRGRNSFYLAKQGYEVVGLDLVASNIAALKEQGLEGYCQSVTEPWPDKGPFAIAIDIFCYKHITDKDLQKRYRSYLRESLQKSGYFLLSLAADDDGFYGPLLAESPDPVHKLIVDPHAKIGSYLYSLDEIVAELSDTLHVVKATKVTSQSPMHGRDYQREVLNIICQKP